MHYSVILLTLFIFFSACLYVWLSDCLFSVFLCHFFCQLLRVCKSLSWFYTMLYNDKMKRFAENPRKWRRKCGNSEPLRDIVKVVADKHINVAHTSTAYISFSLIVAMNAVYTSLFLYTYFCRSAAVYVINYVRWSVCGFSTL